MRLALPSRLADRLALVALVACLPLAAVLFYDTGSLRQVQRRQAIAEARAVAGAGAGQQTRAIDDARRLLLALSRVPVVRDADSAACGRFLRDALGAAPGYADLAVADAGGGVRCRARGVTGGGILRGAPILRQALQGDELAVGDYTRLGLVDAPHLPVALRVPGGDGRILVAALDLAWLGGLLDETNLPARSEILALGDGAVVARVPVADSSDAGTRFASLAARLAEAGPGGSVKARSADGVTRIYGLARLPGPSGRKAAVLAVGIPTSAAFAVWRNAVARNLAGIALALFVAWLFGRIGARRSVTRPTTVLRDAIRMFGEGDRSARAGLRSGDELEEIGAAFDRMAETVGKEREELQRRYEEGLRSLGEQRSAAALFERLPLGVVLVRGPDGDPVLANGAARTLLGIDPVRPDAPESGAELVRQDGTPYPDEDLPPAIALRTGRRATCADVHLRHADGRMSALRMTGVPLDAPDGRERMALVVLEDVTGERRAVGVRDELVARAGRRLRDAAKEAVAALGLLEGAVGPVDGDLVARVRAANGDARRVAENLLAVARIEAGRFTCELRPTPLDDLVRDVLDEYEATFRRRDQRLEVSLPAEPVVARVDREKVRAMFVDLLDNASKFTSDGGRISVELREHAGEAWLRVEDDGIGFHPTELGMADDVGTGAPAAGDSGVDGTGLGLYVVERIVDLHRGRIEAFSAPGGGTTVVVRLPIGRREADVLAGVASESFSSS